jgi:hypothetical protein
MKAYCTLWITIGLFMILFNSCLLLSAEDLTPQGFSLYYTIRYYTGYFGLFVTGGLLIVISLLAYRQSVQQERDELLNTLLEPVVS